MTVLSRLKTLSAPAPREAIAYVGKLPGRKDFIRLSQDLPLMRMMDEWLDRFMRLLSAGAGWQAQFDRMAPVDFAFVSAQRQFALAGHIVPSRDRAGRRFPFLTLHTLAPADPAAFVALAPLVLDALWRRMATLAQAALTPDDPATALHAIGAAKVELAGGAASALSAFLATGTIASLNGLLGQGDARRLLLALGMLLQPVLQSGAPALGKSLALPLPRDAHARGHVAALWIELIAPFLRRTDVELALFITELDGAPVLVVGFSGACAETLQALVDPAARQAGQIGFGDTDWVDRQFGVDIEVRALASYLEQPELPLRLARELFLQAFTGAPG